MTRLLKGSKDTIQVRCKAMISMGLGKQQPVPFIATFKRLSPKETKEVLRAAAEEDKSDADIVREYLITIDDLKGIEDEPVEFNEDVLEEMLEHREYSQALTKGFMEVQLGKELANLKT